jgi:uncharacterized membrane-anchored protein YhcB (DUF1043 family)
MISLQPSTEQIHDVLTWNDATITGILLAVVLAFGSVIYYLFKVNQEQNKTHTARIEQLYQDFTAERDRLYKEHLNDTKGFNELLVKMTHQYHDSVKILADFHKK